VSGPVRYKLAVFDFDGTLANSGEWLMGVLSEMAPRFGFKPIQLQDHERVRGFSSAQFLEHIDLPMWKLPPVINAIRKRALKDAHLLPLYPGVKEMLRDLKTAGIGRSVVSSNSEEAIRIALKDAAELVEDFTCGASLFGKASKLKQVLRRAKIQPREAIYIGDEVRDAIAARKVGMAFGAVSWGYNRVEALRAENPDLIFDSMEEIARTLFLAAG
jgi:phosphoglycolate phosphatase